MRGLSRLLYLAILVVSFALFSGVGLAADSSSTINVTIQSLSEITVTPATLNWTGNLGQQGVLQTLTIRNTGSQNVSNIYSFMSTLSDEPRRPYGTGNAINYSSGGVIALRNSSNAAYYFAGRIEWNWTSDPGNKNLASFISPVSYGFFKNTSYEYFWALGNGTNGLCNTTGAQFGISTYIDNGTVSTRTPSAVGFSTSDLDYGYWAPASGPLAGSCIAAAPDCSYIYVYTYDKRASPNFGACPNSEFLQVPPLVSGDSHVLTLSAFIPNGIPSGYLNSSTFTVVAS